MSDDSSIIVVLKDDFLLKYRLNKRPTIKPILLKLKNSFPVLILHGHTTWPYHINTTIGSVNIEANLELIVPSNSQIVQKTCSHFENAGCIGPCKYDQDRL